MKNAHAGLRDRHITKYRSNERVTCVVLIECGLSLEGVAGVDQEGPPGEGGAKAGFDYRVSQMKAPELPWVSSGPGNPVVMPLCFQCRRYHFNALL